MWRKIPENPFIHTYVAVDLTSSGSLGPAIRLGRHGCAGLACCIRNNYPNRHAYTQVVLDWFGKLLELPQQFLTYASDGKQLPGGGVIQV